MQLKTIPGSKFMTNQLISQTMNSNQLNQLTFQPLVLLDLMIGMKALMIIHMHSSIKIYMMEFLVA